MPDNNRCAFTWRDARRCRMLRSPQHPSLCPFHAAREQSGQRAPRPTATEQMTSRTLDHPWAVRRTIKDLYRLAAADYISLDRARVLARIAELLLVATRRVPRRARRRQSPSETSRQLVN